ncbi:hypothetical protein IT779_27685 [Nocardia sp. NEAU-351]|uniref:Peptidase n=2 Tax=Nocardia bovistercoris TaxID=2785916 RepID=A0A931IGQ1_9NOCA|nr:hypothetical protein [Nocardia bovistercoris]
MHGFRAWCAERGRARFAVTLALLVGLTGAGGALLLVPKVAVPRITAAQPAVAPAGDDPRLAPVRRTMEPFGAVVAERFPTGADREAIVVGHDGQRAEMAVLGAELAPATAAITDLLGRARPGSALVVVASNPSEFAALVRSSSILPGEVAAVTVTDPFPPGAEPSGSRVVFSPEAGRRLSPDALRTLLRHELTHVATRTDTADGAPAWMLEGFAEYAAHRGGGRAFAEIAPTVAGHLAAELLPADLPAAADLVGPRAAEAYESAWTVCAYVADAYGEPRLVDLYRALAAAPLDTAGEDRVLRATLGVGRAEFVTGWRGWLSTRIR